MNMTAQNAATSTVDALTAYHTAMTSFEAQEADIKRNDAHLSSFDVEKALARVTVEKENYSDVTRNEIMAALDEAVQRCDLDENARKISDRDRRRALHQSAAHQAAVANAMSAIQLVGDSMSADLLQEIIDPFIADKDYSTLQVMELLTKECCPQIFNPLTGKAVNFGENPSATRDFMKKLQGLVSGRAFASGTERGTALWVIHDSVNDFFGIKGE